MTTFVFIFISILISILQLISSPFIFSLINLLANFIFWTSCFCHLCFFKVLSNVYYPSVQNYLYPGSFVCGYKHLGYFNDLPLSKFVWIYVSSISFPIKVSHPKVSKIIRSNLLMTSILKSQSSLIVCKALAQ